MKKEEQPNTSRPKQLDNSKEQEQSNRAVQASKPVHRLTKYFDENCRRVFRYKERGHFGKDCPEKVKQVFRLDSTTTKACYIVDSLTGYPVHAQVDSGSTATLVWSKLLLPIPEDALKQTVISFTGESIMLSKIAVTLQILDQTITLNALVYDKAPVDEFLGCNCPNFRTILHHKAEDQQELFVVKMRQQTKEQQKTRRSVEHCTLHADGAWLNELGWLQ